MLIGKTVSRFVWKKNISVVFRGFGIYIMNKFLFSVIWSKDNVSLFFDQNMKTKMVVLKKNVFDNVKFLIFDIVSR